jgi:hypothetical protein
MTNRTNYRGGKSVSLTDWPGTADGLMPEQIREELRAEYARMTEREKARDAAARAMLAALRLFTEAYGKCWALGSCDEAARTAIAAAEAAGITTGE